MWGISCKSLHLKNRKENFNEAGYVLKFDRVSEYLSLQWYKLNKSLWISSSKTDQLGQTVKY